MTAAVGSAASGGAEALVQSVTAKGSSGLRSHVKHSDDSDAASGEPTQSTQRAEADASSVDVQKADKSGRRYNGKGSSSDDDKSFEDTFDSIGQDQSKDSGAQASGTTAFSPDLMTGHIVSSPAAENLDPATTSQNVSRPAALMQQKSILALMDAKTRILANSGDHKPEASGTVDAAAASAVQADTTEFIPVSIGGRETHWNFNSDTMTGIASQIAASQLGGHNLAQGTMQGAASISATKGQAADAKLSGNMPQQPATAAMSGAEQTSGQSFPDGGSANQNGARPQAQGAAEVTAERKITKADTTSSLDQIFSNPNPQPNASAATRQVRDGILDSFAAETAGAGATSLPSGAVPTRATSAPVLRTLDLTLSPPDLGAVKLRMSLSSNSLTIEAEASKSSTAKLLNDDRPNLERGLKDAGYDISSLKITDTSASSNSNSSGWQTNGSPSRDGDQSRSGFAGRQDGEMQRRDGSSFDQSQRRSRDPNSQTAQADAAAVRSGNAIYI
ncbi:MAG TPA: flagellar hook-length control protein FliK [Hyphomicrobium sp.]|nr:flagellar hook-length control protein FliK [Hyphomicrobium sp.]